MKDEGGGESKKVRNGERGFLYAINEKPMENCISS
jgi:hypothetical protein